MQNEEKKTNLVIEDSHYAKKAREAFEAGYNCSQAVVLAFADVMGMDEKTALRLSSSFGGGMGRMREVCGAVSGMLMVAGVLWGFDDPEGNSAKAAHYARVQKLAGEFRGECGSIICRELLGGVPSSTPTPTERTPAFYKKRPCAELVALAAAILEQELREEEKTC